MCLLRIESDLINQSINPQYMNLGLQPVISMSQSVQYAKPIVDNAALNNAKVPMMLQIMYKYLQIILKFYFKWQNYCKIANLCKIYVENSKEL